MALAHDIRALLHAPYRLVPLFRRCLFLLGEDKVKLLLQSSLAKYEADDQRSWLAYFFQALKQLPEKKCIFSRPKIRRRRCHRQRPRGRRY